MGVLLFVLFGVVAGRPRWFELSEAYDFDSYLSDFSKSYDAEEYEMRRGLFESHLLDILVHNNLSGKSWKRGVNHLTDLRPEEIPKGLTMRKSSSAFAQVEDAAVPDQVDWRNATTPVKNQQSCGSCWAFAATESIESAVALATGTLLTLSPQVWVDCAENPNGCGGRGGCSGATAEIAYATAMQLGAFNESDVPYKAEDEPCSLSTLKPAANISGFVTLPKNDYKALLTAVARHPVAVSVDASWSDYESGIFPASEGGTHIDHAVQLVGYGEDDQFGEKYWLVRNSWGPNWGEDGYIRLERREDGMPCAIDTRNQDGVGCADDPARVVVCGTSGILSDSSFPIGAHLT